MGVSSPPLPFSVGCGRPRHQQALLVAGGRTLPPTSQTLLLLSSASFPSSRSPGTHTAPSALLSLQVNSHRHRHQYHFFSDNSQTQSSSPAVTSSRTLCPLGSAVGLSQGLLPWPLCFSSPPPPPASFTGELELICPGFASFYPLAVSLCSQHKCGAPSQSLGGQTATHLSCPPQGSGHTAPSVL